jgi:hypothetical protein
MFRAQQSLLLLLNTAYLAEKQQNSILVFRLTQLGTKPTIYCTQGKHANHYIKDVVSIKRTLINNHSQTCINIQVIHDFTMK